MSKRDLDRDRRLVRKYNLSLVELKELLDRQQGLCLICENDITGTAEHRDGKIAPAAHVDRDHKTGEIRGLLCGPCNSGLGMFKDDPRIVAKAFVYLQDRQK